MIVYVESNFLLELILEQSEFAAANAILDLAGSNRIELAIPAFSLVEPAGTLVRHHKSRKEIYDRMATELGQIKRSSLYEEDATSLLEGLKRLLKINDHEVTAYDRQVEMVCARATVLSLTATVVERSLALRRSEGLSLQEQHDSLVLATILADIESRDPQLAKMLVTKDSALESRAQQQYGAQLLHYNCKTLSSFDSAGKYLDHQFTNKP